MKKLFVPKNTPVVVSFNSFEYVETTTSYDFVFDAKAENMLLGCKKDSTLYECIAYIISFKDFRLTFNAEHCTSLR